MLKTKEITVSYGRKKSVNYQTYDLSVSQTVEIPENGNMEEIREFITLELKEFVEKFLGRK